MSGAAKSGAAFFFETPEEAGEQIVVCGLQRLEERLWVELLLERARDPRELLLDRRDDLLPMQRVAIPTLWL